MVGGNIPGVTRTVSIDIYDQVQASNYAAANATAVLLLVFCFAVLTAVFTGWGDIVAPPQAGVPGRRGGAGTDS